MKEALYYRKEKDARVQCLLCPHECKIKDGKSGICRVRVNKEGTLIAKTFNKVSSLHMDPIEKKPLYHFFPGSNILSIGSLGCNLSCTFCQNCEISQAKVNGYPGLRDITPEEAVALAEKANNNIGIAFTYNEPVIFFEYMLEVAALARTRGLRTVMVSNGFINQEPLARLIPLIDAFNIDLKAFREDFYRKQSGASLAPVKAALRTINKSGKHLEVTNLVIPTLNDDPAVFREMVEWIASELGRHTILHLSRYFPHHKLLLPPTPVSKIMELYAIAKNKLYYVYLGNVSLAEGNATSCIHCRTIVIERTGYHAAAVGVTPDGHCRTCGKTIKNLVI